MDNSQPADEASIVNRALSTSFIAALAPDRKAAVAAEIRSTLEGAMTPLSFPYRAELQAWNKTG
jgi:hypothetical protein